MAFINSGHSNTGEVLLTIPEPDDRIEKLPE